MSALLLPCRHAMLLLCFIVEGCRDAAAYFRHYTPDAAIFAFSRHALRAAYAAALDAFNTPFADACRHMPICHGCCCCCRYFHDADAMLPYSACFTSRCAMQAVYASAMMPAHVTLDASPCLRHCRCLTPLRYDCYYCAQRILTTMRNATPARIMR